MIRRAETPKDYFATFDFLRYYEEIPVNTKGALPTRKPALFPKEKPVSTDTGHILVIVFL